MGEEGRRIPHSSTVWQRVEEEQKTTHVLASFFTKAPHPRNVSGEKELPVVFLLFSGYWNVSLGFQWDSSE